MRTLICLMALSAVPITARSAEPQPDPEGTVIVPNVFPNECRERGGEWDHQSMRCVLNAKTCSDKGGFWSGTASVCVFAIPPRIIRL